MQKFSQAVIGSALALSLAGCAGASKQDVGTVTGGVIGAAIGSQFGGGSGRVIAAAGGAIAGALIGSTIGRYMDQQDQMRMQAAIAQAPVGHTTEWRNPNTGYVYEVTTTRQYVAQRGPCRDYQTIAYIKGKRQVVHGTACRMPNGTWRTVN